MCRMPVESKLFEACSLQLHPPRTRRLTRERQWRSLSLRRVGSLFVSADVGTGAFRDRRSGVIDGVREQRAVIDRRRAALRLEATRIAVDARERHRPSRIAIRAVHLEALPL